MKLHYNATKEEKERERVQQAVLLSRKLLI